MLTLLLLLWIPGKIARDTLPCFHCSRTDRYHPLVPTADVMYVYNAENMAIQELLVSTIYDVSSNKHKNLLKHLLYNGSLKIRKFGESNGGMHMFFFLMNEFSRGCPRCAIMICRDEGCNKVDCLYCGFQFCWSCRDPWSQRSCGFYECGKDISTQSSSSSHYTKVNRGGYQ